MPEKPGARGLSWPRLPAWLELATIGAGYSAYSLVRADLPATRHTALAHASQIWQAERWLHINIEPYLNHLVAAQAVLAVTAGYYYGLLHFILTPLVLLWLYVRRPAAFPRLRSALVLATVAATAVFWAWPLAPPRFAVPGMTDILVARDILGAANPHGVSGLVNLYAAMPSLHVAWATWCATAVVTAARGRWRHLAWLYPAATTFVVLASASHFILDAAGGAAIMALGLLAAGVPRHRRHSASLPKTAPADVRGHRHQLGSIQISALVPTSAERVACRPLNLGLPGRRSAAGPAPRLACGPLRIVPAAGMACVTRTGSCRSALARGEGIVGSEPSQAPPDEWPDGQPGGQEPGEGGHEPGWISKQEHGCVAGPQTGRPQRRGCHVH